MNMTATIKDIDENKNITVLYCQDEECSTCGGGCSTGFRKKETTLTASNVRGLPLKEGDAVELFISPWKAIKAGFLIFILPLLFFFAFYFAGESWFAITSESLRVLFGVGGIVLGFLLNVVVKLAAKGKDLPEIIRKIS